MLHSVSVVFIFNMEFVLCESEVRDLVKSIIDSENIIDPELNISGGSTKGDGYLSFLTRVDIKGRNKILHLMIKCAPRQAEFRQLAPVRLAFIREIYMYDVVLPELMKLQNDKNVRNPFNSIAKCYKSADSEDMELLVLENLKENGFSMWNRMNGMDEEHVKLVCKEYGKFHALSYALRLQHREMFDDMTKDMKDILKDGSEEILKMLVYSAEKAKKLFNVDTEKHICEALERFDVAEYLKYISENLGQNLVILHGDCWCNNMMFKYDDESNPKQPTSMRLLDFQLARPASPVLDLSYYFYVSTPKNILDNLDHYLGIYYKSFCQNLNDLGCKSDDIFTFSDLKRDWKIFGKFGYIMSLMVLRAALVEKDDVVDITDFVKSGENFQEFLDRDLGNMESITDRQRDIIIHLYEIGLI